MKMACGENPKNQYGQEKRIMPESRLGEGYLFRRAFQDALDFKNSQDIWCENAISLSDKHGVNAYKQMLIPFPENEDLEVLSSLLRGHVDLHNHCYETYDMEMMLRNANKFNFKVTTFHHALEAWRVADKLALENISVAIFADHWGYKKEADGTSVRAAQILSKAGVKVTLKSDHPVLNSQHLIFEAQKAHHYGLDSTLALKSVTSIAAEVLKIGDRVGKISRGFDGDFVVWNRFILLI